MPLDNARDLRQHRSHDKDDDDDRAAKSYRSTSLDDVQNSSLVRAEIARRIVVEDQKGRPRRRRNEKAAIDITNSRAGSGCNADKEGKERSVG